MHINASSFVHFRCLHDALRLFGMHLSAQTLVPGINAHHEKA